MQIKLCCLVNPIYQCTVCGFRECDDCWNHTVETEGTHFTGEDEDICSATGILTKHRGRIVTGITYWDKE